MFTPHVMCANCQHVFPSEATLGETVTCPNCGFDGKPARVMKATGFPSLETFKRNWQRSKGRLEEEKEDSS